MSYPVEFVWRRDQDCESENGALMQFVRQMRLDGADDEGPVGTPLQ